MVEIILGAGVALAALGGWYSFRSAQREEELQWNWEGRNTDTLLFSPIEGEFLWGTATAAFQVEGHSSNSNWSDWENSTDKKGNPRIHGGQKAGEACDHYNRFATDISAMANDLGCNSYRFSLA